MKNINGALYFTSNSGTNGYKLWASNGFATGTVMILDIVPCNGSSTPDGFVEMEGYVAFAANSSATGLEVFKSNGTNSVTVLVIDLRSGTPSSSPQNFVKFNGLLYFSANDGTTLNSGTTIRSSEPSSPATSI